MQTRVVYQFQKESAPLDRVRLSPDDLYFACPAHEEVLVFSVATGTLICSLRLPEEGYYCSDLAWTHDGQGLLLYCVTGHVIYWDITTGEHRTLYQHGISLLYENTPATIAGFSWSSLSPDRKLLATLGFGPETTIQIRAWQSASLVAIFEDKEPFDEAQKWLYERDLPITNPIFLAFCWSSQGDRVVIGQGHKAYLWDYQHDQILSVFQTDMYWMRRIFGWENEKDPDEVRLCALSADGASLVLTGMCSLETWNVTPSHKWCAYDGHQGTVFHAQWNERGDEIISLSEESIHQWEAKTGRMLQSALFQNLSDDKITIFDMALTTDLKQVIAVGKVVKHEEVEVVKHEEVEVVEHEEMEVVEHEEMEKAMIWRWEVSGL